VVPYYEKGILAGSTSGLPALMSWYVQVCWPINTYIQPGDNYTLAVQAEPAVLDTINWDLNNGTLELSTIGGFTTGYPILAVVGSPSCQWYCSGDPFIGEPA
jgi:hypothetical protein